MSTLGLNINPKLIGHGISFQPESFSAFIHQFVAEKATAIVWASDVIA